MTRARISVAVVAMLAWASAASGGPGDVSYSDPAWSPDGRQIAFVDRFGGHPGDLFVAGADGTNVRQLTHSNSDYSRNEYGARTPDWSPNGRLIAFGYGYGDIDLIAPDGGGRRVLTTGIAGNGAVVPQWSPHGRWIAFTDVGDTDPSTVKVIAPNGKGRITVAWASNIAHSYEAATWSPDGERLAFSIRPAPSLGWIGVPRALGVISQFGGRVRLVKTAPYRATEPDWSPDGNRILFTDNGHGIVLQDLRTGRQRRIFTRPGFVFFPRWSPDGKRIAFAYRGGIWVLRADGSQLRRLIG